MSLLEALLLDPVRIDVWIADRGSDGIAGSGTQTDPYDGSTLAKFDALMSGMAVNTCIHLGPGEFETAGFFEGAAGPYWKPKNGMRIVGSGIDVTTLKLVNGAANDQRVYAVVAAYGSNPPPYTTTVAGRSYGPPGLRYGTVADFFELRDLTIDCNLGGVSGATSAAGAVRLMGNHSRVVRVKVTNCGIEECIAVSPHDSTTGPIAILHVGGKEDATNAAEAFGLGPYIRNCFVDSGQTAPFSKEFIGLSIAWCKGGVIEGNQIQNTKFGGPYQAATGARDVVVRNNTCRNVYKGPYWNLTATQGVQRVLIEPRSTAFG